MRENQSGQCVVSCEANRFTSAWSNSFQRSSTTLGWSLHSPVSAPVSKRCPLPDWGTQGCRLLWVRGAFPEPTGGSSEPAYKGGTNADTTIGWCRRPPMCCLCGQAHGVPTGLEGSVSEIEIWPESPGSLCAMWDDDLSKEPGQSGHSWLPPSLWGRRPLLVLRDDKEPPTSGLEPGTNVSSTCPRHVSMTLIMQSRFSLGENPLVLSHHCRGSHVQQFKRYRILLWQLPSDPTVSETVWQWVTGLLSFSWLPWGSTRYEQETDLPAPWSNPTPRPDKSNQVTFIYIALLSLCQSNSTISK